MWVGECGRVWESVGGSVGGSVCGWESVWVGECRWESMGGSVWVGECRWESMGGSVWVGECGWESVGGRVCMKCKLGMCNVDSSSMYLVQFPWQRSSR